MDMTASERIRMGMTGADRAEQLARDLDRETKERTGISLFHILTAAAIVGSLILFFTGRRTAAIFVGLWPPTFQALKSAADR
jgi:hypothetical protein